MMHLYNFKMFFLEILWSFIFRAYLSITEAACSRKESGQREKRAGFTWIYCALSLVVKEKAWKVTKEASEITHTLLSIQSLFSSGTLCWSSE